LSETSLVQVIGDRPDAVWLLVQEEAMSHKPSLLLQLTVAEILRYWALLTAEQRAAFIEQRFPDLSATATGRDLLARLPPLRTVDSFFDRFAGIFHAFGCLERSVRDALAQDREKDAAYRLFGQKYDSLPTLLGQLAEEGSGSDIDRYVMVLSARQMCEELKRAFPDFWDRHLADAVSIGNQLGALDQIRQRLIAHDPDAMPAFLQWFDRWFLKRAQPEEVADA
jgi:hypothetical protein